MTHKHPLSVRQQQKGSRGHTGAHEGRGGGGGAIVLVQRQTDQSTTCSAKAAGLAAAFLTKGEPQSRLGAEQERMWARGEGREVAGSLGEQSGGEGVLPNPSDVCSLPLLFDLPNLWQSTSVPLIPDDKV